MRKSRKAVAVLVAGAALVSFGAWSPAGAITSTHPSVKTAASSTATNANITLPSSNATAVSPPKANISLGSGTNVSLLEKAVPDECFIWDAATSSTTATDGGSYTMPSSGQCNAGDGSVPKVNQAYVWGMTQTPATGSPSNLWFGTVANTECLVEGETLGATNPVITPGLLACEFGQSPLIKQYPQLPAGAGDFEAPHLYQFNPGTQQLTLLDSELPSTLGSASQISSTGALSTSLQSAASLLSMTIGIRSAGTSPDGSVVFFAGPAYALSFSTSGGTVTPTATQDINIFAFSSSGKFLGAVADQQYNDIRRWSVAGKSLFAGVSNSSDNSGSILRWDGTGPSTPTGTVSAANLWKFTVVGHTDAEVSELAPFGNYLLAGTWASNYVNNAGIWASPVPVASLTAANGTATAGTSAAWKEVWQVGQYEPDPAIATSYGIGRMMAFGNYVYFGTMHVPGQSLLALRTWYPNELPTGRGSGLQNATRTISLFRLSMGPNSMTPWAPPTSAAPTSTNTSMQLLYGNASLPVFVPPTAPATTGTWTTAPNKMTGADGLWGTSGFGPAGSYTNLLYVNNNYTWSMAVYHGALYVGTMNDTITQYSANRLPQTASLPGTNGAQLWRFPNTSSAAQLVAGNGVDNWLNYGIRNMVAVNGGPNDGLYLGMANPNNLATPNPYYPSNTAPYTGNPAGGWELLKLTAP